VAQGLGSAARSGPLSARVWSSEQVANQQHDGHPDGVDRGVVQREGRGPVDAAVHQRWCPKDEHWFDLRDPVDHDCIADWAA
jgi:hypothetical protein